MVTSKNKLKTNKSVIIALSVFAIAIAALIIRATFGSSKADILDNDVEVERNSLLTYYLKVNYDGVDVNGVRSSDETTAEVKSGIMTISDKIPNGLEFQGFVETDNGSIGAVKRSDDTTCLGKVIDDTGDTVGWNQAHTEYVYHGLHYTTADRTVNFKVTNLKAGCYLTVGIITKTPATIDDPETDEVEKRRDFYNFANATENELSVNSNTVHAFIGSSDIETFTVSYEYEGDIPEGAPSVPLSSNYVKGANVGVANDASLTGYTFSGWTTEDATVENGTFLMPEQNVIFKGHFTADSTNEVVYEIDGVAPEGYIKPKTKSYPKKSSVSVDSLSEGDIIDGYRFLGWTSDDVEITDDSFIMPDSNVTLRGTFEEVTYKITYKFYDTILPPNSESLLPAEKTYKPGQTVTLDEVTEPAGYKFLGWYHEDEFEMPEEDVTIYGEWKREAGTFEPTITAVVDDNKTYFEPRDFIKYKVTVTNTASYPIREVYVKGELEDFGFTPKDGYEVPTDKIAVIGSLAAGQSITLEGVYKVKETDTNKVNMTFAIKGAIADNDYSLKEGTYEASVSSNLKSKVEICNTITGSYADNSFDVNINNNSYDTWMNLKKDECKYVFVEPGTYKIKEVIPEEYKINSVTGISSNGSNLNVVQGTNYKIEFEHSFVRKGFFHSYGRAKNTVLGGN